MVLTEVRPKRNDVTGKNCELMLESGKQIYYVAPVDANPVRNMSIFAQENMYCMPTKRKGSSNDDSGVEEWQGVNALCQMVDNAIEIEMDKDMFFGKRVLEIGFCTGLPSLFAWDNGASEVALHCYSKADLDFYVKPTMRRNNIPLNRCKFSSGDLAACKRALGGKKFDVVLAPELINTNESDFDAIHEIIDLALADDGICLMSARAYYPGVSGNLPSFLDLVKHRGRFDVFVRWQSPKTEIIPRKVIQLTHTIR
uniref:Methyltransf_11 domain-containing protein n=1 Tax=Steinernema glaseri TaxID=37863 RepID=A0A1I7XZF2_9BILA